MEIEGIRCLEIEVDITVHKDTDRTPRKSSSQPSKFSIQVVSIITVQTDFARGEHTSQSIEL